MKNRLYQIRIIMNILWCLIFICLVPVEILCESTVNQAGTEVNGTTKRRRRSKQDRLKNQKNNNINQDPAVARINSMIKGAEIMPALDHVQADVQSKNLEVTQSELASAFKEQEDTESHLIKNPNNLWPWQAIYDTTNLISVNLDKTELLNFLQWIEAIFKVKFLTGDSVTPSAPGKVSGNLITYKTHKPMTKREVWDLFLNLLDLFGLTLVATHYTDYLHTSETADDYPDSYTVMPTDMANQAALPSFVGIDWQALPNNDTKIRYVYFVENGPAADLANLVQDFKSKSAIVQTFNALNAIIFTDKSANIRSLMAIIAELDGVSMPEAMSVLKLKHANAEDVVKLYQELVSTEDKGAANNIVTRLFGAKKQPTAVYFPENTRLIPEPRSNALVILGNREGITKVENFIIEYVDTKLKQPYSPLYVYKLEYANAENVAAILSKVTNFAPGSPAAAYGGVRDGDKYFRPMTFIAEPSGNRLLIKAEKDDYLKVVEGIIKKLDIKQPQVAIEVLIVNVSSTKIKALGAQLRNKRLDTLGITDNIAFQTSGIGTSGSLSHIVPDVDGGLMGNLVSLATGFNPGTTLISIGNNFVGGVWALFQALETYAYANVVSHPFLTTTNKFTAQVSVGETRRVATGTVTGAGPTQNTLGDVSANLSVAITPQINTEGIINMAIEISIDTFTDPEATSPTKNTQIIKTNANLANNEILAIGGLIQDNISEVQNGVPILQRVPLLGWFFKNKAKTKIRNNLIVFISPQIVQPRNQGGVGPYTEIKAALAQNDMCSMRHCSEQRDPIHRWFFRDHPCEDVEKIDEFINPNECNVVVGVNCRTGQPCQEDTVCTDIARVCPPVVCPNNYVDCAQRCSCDHVTPLCEPENPRPCQPISQCPETEYAPISNRVCPNNYENCRERCSCSPDQPFTTRETEYVQVCENDKSDKVAERPNATFAQNTNQEVVPKKRTTLQRKQSVTDFLSNKNEVVA